ETQLESGGGKRPTFRASVPNEADRLRILAGYDFGMGDEPFPEEILLDEKAMAVFVRGAFLGCGNISDPQTEYRVDFSVREQARAEALREMLVSHDIPASLSKRGTGYVVYLRKSEAIINLLTWIGLSDRSLEMIETTILKSVKNNMNRARNCDNANISKTVEASIRQRTAIAFLEQSGRLETLPQALYSAAVLRREHPDATLHELCRLSPEPITDSGLNHRLCRLVELYEEYKN
ncbi:MAG: DNA-binding protein WhiA, partial [Clostridia bacterium]|nr:DNA-binding protein WhiA [Clostridia bacterium]